MDIYGMFTNDENNIFNTLDLKGNTLTDVGEALSDNDVVTKNYVDKLNSAKCLTGYIPKLNINVNFCGFIISSSGEYNSDYSASGIFRNATWVSNSLGPGWLKIECPEQVKIWRFTISGLATNNASNVPIVSTKWNLEGSSDNVTWVKIYDNIRPLTKAIQFIEVNVDKMFKFYRYNCLESNSNPGLSHLQLYVYNLI